VNYGIECREHYRHCLSFPSPLSIHHHLASSQRWTRTAFALQVGHTLPITFLRCSITYSQLYSYRSITADYIHLLFKYHPINRPKMGAEFIVTLIVALFVLLIAMCIGTAFTTPFHGAVIR
jgi:hypothetical protein